MFRIINEDKKARTGEFETKSGTISTPFFMPCATHGTAKNLSPEDLERTKTQCIISNSYLLSSRPGTDIIKRAGGLHKYMNWKGSIFTDSGGFQMVVPGFLQEVTDKGIKFKNPLSKEIRLFTPEDSMKIQIEIDSDVAMALDHVPFYKKDYDYIKECVQRTKLWAEKCIKLHKALKKETGSKQLLFGICQGGIYEDLREESAKHIADLDFDGVAYGGLAFGEPVDEMFKSIRAANKVYPKGKIRYLMGVGYPPDMLDAIAEGIDMFDSVYPTKNARRGTLFTKDGMFKIQKGKFRNDFGPIDKGCKCYTCTNHNRAYVSHLLRSHEMYGMRLASIHNIYFVQNMLEEAKRAIKEKRFDEYRKEFRERFGTKEMSQTFFGGD